MYFEHLKVPGKNPTKLYLAVPYSHANPVWKRLRFELANLAAMQLIACGFIVFSPISHSHPIAETCAGLADHHAMWLHQDTHFMTWADRLVVLQCPGWKESRGVQYEVDWFEERNKPVGYMGISDVYYAEAARGPA